MIPYKLSYKHEIAIHITPIGSNNQLLTMPHRRRSAERSLCSSINSVDRAPPSGPNRVWHQLHYQFASVRTSEQRVTQSRAISVLNLQHGTLQVACRTRDVPTRRQSRSLTPSRVQLSRRVNLTGSCSHQNSQEISARYHREVLLAIDTRLPDQQAYLR